MESCNSLHTDVAEANTNVTPSLDDQGSTGVKRSRITQSPIMQYFKLMHDCTYSCEICRQKYLDGMQGVIKRPTDGSTNIFKKHFKVVHQRLYDALKGIGDDNGSQQCIITEGAAGQLKSEAPNKRPLRGLPPMRRRMSLPVSCASLTTLEHRRPQSFQGVMAICNINRSKSPKCKGHKVMDN